jgi:hypothetical protein
MRRLGFARENDTGVAPPEAGRRLTDKNNPMLCGQATLPILALCCSGFWWVRSTASSTLL